MAWLLRTAYRKRQDERNDLNMELLSRKEPELKDLKISQPVRIVENEKLWLEENSEGVAKRTFDKEQTKKLRQTGRRLERPLGNERKRDFFRGWFCYSFVSMLFLSCKLGLVSCKHSKTDFQSAVLKADHRGAEHPATRTLAFALSSQEKKA